ncbi:MAG: rhodoquinone biosynthesis methyltransferase RquA [Alphaproteobacteria bacterium]|nr:rhodoquinone biosynthesis methyltransferase RquA [Alphaproteobacteria bacterium]
MKKNINNISKIPPYQKEYYSWLYESKILSKLIDRDWLLNLITFGTHKKLINICTEEVYPQQKTLQVGVTFGSQLARIAERLGVYGEFDIVDVSATQIRRIRKKYRFLYPSMNFINRDAVNRTENRYNTIICYKLLHEMPLATRTKLINTLLSTMSPGGKVVFIDYNKPAWWNPLRIFIQLYNRLYQPFSESLWDKEIKDFTTAKGQFEWKKSTYFGKMYQKVVVRRKETLY